jgi:hypothetical protein
MRLTEQERDDVLDRLEVVAGGFNALAGAWWAATITGIACLLNPVILFGAVVLGVVLTCCCVALGQGKRALENAAAQQQQQAAATR